MKMLVAITLLSFGFAAVSSASVNPETNRSPTSISAAVQKRIDDCRAHAGGNFAQKKAPEPPTIAEADTALAPIHTGKVQ